MEIRSFLGLEAYYCRFVEGFSSIATPMIRLTQKGAPFRWTEECDESFQKLKTTLTIALVLVVPSESLGSLAYLPVSERPLALDVQALTNQFVRLDISEPSRMLACVVSQSSLYNRIRERQYDDPHLLVLKDTIHHGHAKEVTIGDNGALRMQGRLCVPNVDGLHELILQEAHNLTYSIHPGVAKMYQDLRQHYWWRRMKKDIVEYVA
ncbi:uncharacterized protein [Nicotiana sylvestris]|uniref:uncharacterized protein n=1 Tax=Nicotiana sylvestris TaxID=4096 RepID=UPI00388CD4E0